MIKVLSVAFVCMTALAGCGDSYRYPCQNPDNWDKYICQKPMCEVTRSCPEHILKEPECKK